MANGNPVNIPELTEFVYALIYFRIGRSPRGLLYLKLVERNAKTLTKSMTRTTESRSP